MGWLAPRPGRFTPGKETRYPLYRRLGGSQGPSGRLRKISPQPGFDSRTVQPVASRYTDCAIPAHVFFSIKLKLKLDIDASIMSVGPNIAKSSRENHCVSYLFISILGVYTDTLE
jgi:hypothetical protein